MCKHPPLQGIFPTQGSNPGLRHCRQIRYRLSHQGSPVSAVCVPNAPEPNLHRLKGRWGDKYIKGEISGGWHPPAFPPHLETGRTPCTPILQLGSPAPSPRSHPHLRFLLGSPWGPERPPAHRGLPHPLRVLSHLETTKSGNHLRGWDGPCHAPHLALFGDAKVQEWGGRKGTQPHAKKQPHSRAQRHAPA